MNRLRSLRQSRFIKHSLILFSGSVINNLFLIITYPIIARLFLPADFGLFEQVNAIFAFLVILTSLRYESAIIIAKSDQEAKNLLVLSLLVLISLVLIVSGCIVVLGSQIADLFSSPQLEQFLYFIPIFLLFAGGQQVFYNWEIRKKRFSQANVSNIFKSSSNSIFRVITGFAQLSTLGLFLARGVSFFLSLWILLKKEWTELFRSVSNRTVTTQGMIAAAKVHKDFPLYMSWGVVIGKVSTILIPLAISFLYGVTFLGYYVMANTALNIPIAMVKNAIHTVYLQRASERVTTGKDLHNDLKKITLTILGIGILPMALIVLYGPPVFTFVLGERWQMTGVIASIISPWIYFTLVATPCTAVVPVIGLQRYYVVLQFVILSTRILVFYIGVTIFEEPLNVIKLLVIQGILVNIFNLGYVLMKTRKKDAIIKYSLY